VIFPYNKRSFLVPGLIIGVLSDTHDNLPNLRKVLGEFNELGVKTVIHLGDFISPFTVRLMREELKNARVIGILGNNDGDILQLTKLFAEAGWELYSGVKTIELSGRRIALLHGYGSVSETESLARNLARSLDVDAVLFGHTHRPLVEKTGGRLILNPGEACGYLTNKATFAIVDLSTLEVSILEVGRVG
jgi:putative phosphoesterase